MVLAVSGEESSLTLTLFFPSFLTPLSSFLILFLFPPFLSITLERVQVMADEGQPN